MRSAAFEMGPGVVSLINYAGALRAIVRLLHSVGLRMRALSDIFKIRYFGSVFQVEVLKVEVPNVAFKPSLLMEKLSRSQRQRWGLWRDSSPSYFSVFFSHLPCETITNSAIRFF